MERKTIHRYDTLAIGWVIAVFLMVAGAFAVANAQTVSQEIDPGMSGPQVTALQTFLAADASIYPRASSPDTTAISRLLRCSASSANTALFAKAP